MPKGRSPINANAHKDRPGSLDDVARREDIPGTGKMPREFEDLVSSNYLYLHKRGKTPPRLDLQPEFNTTELSAWRVPLGADVQEGLPGRSLKQITVDDLEVGADDDRSEDSFRPDWLTLAFQPRVAPPQPPRPVRFLRRRNGVLVVPELVIGNDDRVVFTPLAWPWTLIGRIDTWVAFPGNTFSPAGSGTGALVGKNVVLTASHLVPWWAEALGRPWMMKFVPAYYDGFSKLGAGVYSYVSELRGYADHSQGDDMAVLKLYQPLGESLGFFGYKTYNDDWEGDDRWIIMGYPAAVAGGNRPSLQFWVIIHDDDSDGAGVELEHTGDTSPGNSGGPLWGWFGDSPRIVGTISGAEAQPFQSNNVAAGGPALSKLIKWARNNW
jgi:V8-like Glu-specific endopeptidase